MIAGRHRKGLFVIAVLAGSIGIPAHAAEDWVTVNKDYSSQRYVDLDQITPENVGTLQEICELQLNEANWFSSGLLMVGRTLYVTTLRATYAIDATTCALRWRHLIQLDETAKQISSRGPGYADGTIFRGTVDGRLIALDAETGAVLWDKKHADPTKNEAFISAPIAWKGKVFIGTAKSEEGIRGRMMAIDAKTGMELWRFYTVPGSIPGEPSWGGGGFWSSFSLDPATGEVLVPAANPAPLFRLEDRPGPNLYTNSVVALDAATGKLSWYYQVTPRDDHDWDYGTAPTLYRTRAGKDMVAAAGKNGYVVGLDRATRAVVFSTPATTISNNGPVTWETPQRVCPGIGGGAQFTGAAYSPVLGALYVGMVDWCSYYAKPRPPQESAVSVDFSVQPKGRITAIDGESGHVLWNYQTEGPALAGLVPTKSGIVFAGDNRGNLFAFDARSGAVLKRIRAGGALNSGLISYAVDGKQYVAAAVGGITWNSAGVSGPLKVSIFGLPAGVTKMLKLERLPTQTTGHAAIAETFNRICANCHGDGKGGQIYPSLVAYPELSDPERLERFLATVPPPMPRLYPGLLDSDDVRRIAAYLEGITRSPSPQWRTIYSVLTHPTCLNCHTSTDYPRQTVDRRRHLFEVVRGADDRGAQILRCSSCHGSDNDAVSGIPGAPDWHIAPPSMSWEQAPGVAMTGPDLCARLKDKSRNGNRDLAGLVEHVDKDPIVNWAWNPGNRPNDEARPTPPVSHDEFVKAFKEWADAGAACPPQ